ncbi:MAG TPA: PepSY-associated TM helix domain-containing protein [Planctomycetota bacterium]|nr:PepSY-associated TM helix domain-containing protein [Planctomycetota bacterium]
MSASHLITPPPVDAAVTVASSRKLRGVVRQVHFIFAIVAGLLLSVVTVSGALVIFRTELDWLYADTTGIAVSRTAEVDATAAMLAERYPTARVQRLATPVFTRAGDEWTLRDEKGTKELSDDEVWKAFTDPATGRFLGDTRGAQGSAFLAWMATFHHNLWLGPTGGILTGSAGLCLFGFILTGVWLWWPGLKKLSSGFRLRWAKPGYFRNYDLHSWFGLVGLPIFLVLALTGSMFEFHWMRSAVHYGLGGNEADRPLALRMQPQRPPSETGKPGENAAKPDAAVKRERGSEERATVATKGPTLTFGKAIAAAEAALPGTGALSIIPPRAGRADATWSVLLDYPFNVGSYSGALVQLTQDGTPKLTLDPRTMSVGGWVNGQVWGLHTGTWAGAWSKTLYLIVGLLPPALLFTGFLLWWYRHQQKNIAAARRATTVILPTPPAH